MNYRKLPLLFSIITFIVCYLAAPIIIGFISLRFNVIIYTDSRFINIAVAGFIAASIYLIIACCLHKSEND